MYILNWHTNTYIYTTAPRCDWVVRLFQHTHKNTAHCDSMHGLYKQTHKTAHYVSMHNKYQHEDKHTHTALTHLIVYISTHTHTAHCDTIPSLLLNTHTQLTVTECTQYTNTDIHTWIKSWLTVTQSPPYTCRHMHTHTHISLWLNAQPIPSHTYAHPHTTHSDTMHTM